MNLQLVQHEPEEVAGGAGADEDDSGSHPELFEAREQVEKVHLLDLCRDKEVFLP